MSDQIIPMEAGKRRIPWIRVEERVPDDRRNVLVWGRTTVLFGTLPWRHGFLGVSKYNAAEGGGGSFDCQRLGPWSFFIHQVTHWADIKGPL